MTPETTRPSLNPAMNPATRSSATLPGSPADTLPNRDGYVGGASTLERDIDRTRERIGRRVEELEQRLSPGELVDQALGYLKGHGSDLANRATRSARENPMPLLTVGAGLVWLAMSAGRRRRFDDDRYVVDDGSAFGDRMRNATDRMRDSVSSTAGAIAERASRLGHEASDALSPVAQRLSGTIDGVRGSVRSATSGAQHQVDHARHEFSVMIEQQPLVVGAVGVVIGAALGALVPVSRFEQESLGGLGASVRDGAGDLAAESYETLREHAREAVEEITHRVTDSPRSDSPRSDSPRSDSPRSDSPRSGSPEAG